MWRNGRSDQGNWECVYVMQNTYGLFSDSLSLSMCLHAYVPIQNITRSNDGWNGCYHTTKLFSVIRKHFIILSLSLVRSFHLCIAWQIHGRSHTKIKAKLKLKLKFQIKKANTHGQRARIRVRTQKAAEQQWMLNYQETDVVDDRVWLTFSSEQIITVIFASGRFVCTPATFNISNVCSKFRCPNAAHAFLVWFRLVGYVVSQG